MYCIKWRVLWRWLKFKHVSVTTQFFMNKFWGFLGPPSYYPKYLCRSPCLPVCSVCFLCLLSEGCMRTAKTYLIKEFTKTMDSQCSSLWLLMPRGEPVYSLPASALEWLKSKMNGGITFNRMHTIKVYIPWDICKKVLHYQYIKIIWSCVIKKKEETDFVESGTF